MNLERLACGHLYLTPVINMFTNTSNVPTSQVMVDAIIKVTNFTSNPVHMSCSPLFWEHLN